MSTPDDGSNDGAGGGTGDAQAGAVAGGGKPRRTAEAGKRQTGRPSRSTPRTAKAANDSSRRTREIPVVAVGASAGGLAAVQQFLAGIPAGTETGLAFVLVQHLDPDHKSMLKGLLEKGTHLGVEVAEDGVEVRAERLYINPPSKELALLAGRLRLVEPRVVHGVRLPIDAFFRSLADDRGERAIGIVLSGTGSDGTLGISAIKGAGGMVMAQLPETAAYDGMPRSAIDSGAVDYVLPPAAMWPELSAYTHHAFRRRKRHAAAAPRGTTSALAEILTIVRAQHHLDFSAYKPSTVVRRIERRLAVNQIDGMENYVRLLHRDRLEVERLFRELLIGVTSFFRDPPAWEALASKVVPQIEDERGRNAPLRLWVPGCSTGEEAYSLAILLQERAHEIGRDAQAQIFASDVDAEAIERARAGVFPESIAADVTPERLARFFRHEQGSYRVSKPVRDMIVFARHDVTRDPPFARIDLLSCRNMLIYMGAELQRRLFPLFHFALAEQGYLFLGTSETVGDAHDLFSVVDRKWKIYRRRSTARPRAAVPLVAPPPAPLPVGLPQAGKPPEMPSSLRVLVERLLLDEHAPAAVMINAEADVLYIHGRTGRFLEPPRGEASANLLRMAREGLELPLAAAVREALTSKSAVRREGIRVRSNGDSIFVDVTVRPIPGEVAARGTLLVILEGRADHAEQSAPSPSATDHQQERIKQLERELTSTQEYLRTSVEELESSNEELKSTNEELQSTNEELQSVNEELETSTEELQSVNEELVTVNNELEQKLDELSRANNDMSNLLAGTGIATLFVDHAMRIQRFTPAATDIINLIGTDVGRPVSDIVSRLTGYDRFLDDLRRVLDTLVPVEAEVETLEGRRYLMRIQPYRTMDNVIEGAVLTFVDITAQTELTRRLERAALGATRSQAASECVLNALERSTLVVDGDLIVTAAGSEAAATLGLPADAVVWHTLPELFGDAWEGGDLAAAVRSALADGPPAATARVTAVTAPPERRLEVTVSRLPNGAGGETFVLLKLG